MSARILYSTNVYLKFAIQRDFRDNIHYVWCSECFDSQTADRYSAVAEIPRSSNPADIYRELLQDCKTEDRHSAKISAQRLSLMERAQSWLNEGSANEEQRDEILYRVKNATFKDWRPLVYVIPRELVALRIRPVQAQLRAGTGPEYIVEDLSRDEFDILEL